MERVVETDKLEVHYSTPLGILHAVDGISLHVDAGETLGLVGESGCGKSTLARCIVGISKPTRGSVWLPKVSNKGGKITRRMRASAVQMVFQDPMGSLNPRLTVGRIIEEPLIVNRIRAAERRARVEEIMKQVGLTQHYTRQFPHELSGGQRQRVSIARALTLKPDILVCDEPVSALDVSVQAQVLNLLLDLQKHMNIAYLFISHDLSVVRYISHRIAVMYLGRIVEIGPADSVWTKRFHPYTSALINAIPDENVVQDMAVLLEGDVPSPVNPPSGCNFRTRCPMAQSKCVEEIPQLHKRVGQHAVACHFVEDV
jgi:oligopeptide/dipeptide ABC transporter ATP-binding protein